MHFNPERLTMTPELYPSVWAGIWLTLTQPLWQGVVMAMAISVLRVLYEAKETSALRILLESLLCGGLSLCASSIIEWMAWPPNLSIGAGGVIGFVGVKALRDVIVRFIHRKVDAA
jgi:lambda family phage holin